MMKATLNKPINSIINPAINEPYTGTPVRGVVLDCSMQDMGKVAIDYSGYGNHGAITGASSAVVYSGRAMNFDGLDDIINFGEPSHINNLSKMTIEMWFNQRSYGAFGGGANAWHINKGAKYILYCPKSIYIFFLREFTTTNGIWRINQIIYNGIWYHVVMSYDSSNASNTPMFYVNGKLAGTTTITTPVGNAKPDTTYDLLVGNYNDATHGFDGTIGIVRIYNRILTPTEIAYNYKQDAWRYGLEA